MNSLLSAARVLKGSEGADISQQINFVSNALVQGRRDRQVSMKKEGLPSEARNVLENIKVQVGNILFVTLDLEKSDTCYQQVLTALKVIESFVNRVIDHYQASEIEVVKEVRESLAKAKLETESLFSIKKLYHQLQVLKNNYQDNPNIPAVEFKEQLQQLSYSVNSIEKEIITLKEPFGEEPEAIFSHLNFLKKELASAFALSEQSEHPRIVGEVALNLLRMASDMIQRAKDQFVVQQALKMAEEANSNLVKSSENFQELAITYNTLIETKTASFVDTAIRKLEQEVKKPVYCVPSNPENNEKISDRMQRQKERLLTYFDLAKDWSGYRQEDFLERIAILFETINDRARKAGKLLENTASSYPDASVKKLISKQAINFKGLAELGSDRVDPEAIFRPKP